MPTIQIRIDEKTKKSAKKVLDNIGMDMSSAVKVYLKQIVITQGIPFQMLTENGLTIQQEKEILKASEEAQAGKNITRIKSTKDLKNYLKSLKNDN